MLSKNKTYVAAVTGLQPHGNGLATVFGKTIIIPGAVPGDEVEFKLIKLSKSYGVGKLLRINIPSKKRVEPRCSILKVCGGCHLQHLTYAEQLNHKWTMIRNYLNGFPALLPIRLNDVIPAEHPFEYRNKAQFAFQKLPSGSITVGLYSVMSHRVADTEYCAIQDKRINHVLTALRRWLSQNLDLSVYDEISLRGDLRHVVIRSGAATGELMVALVVSSSDFPEKRSFVEAMKKVEGVASILLNINSEPGNTVLGQTTECLFGKESISDISNGIQYDFSLNSFTQSNPTMADALYRYVVQKVSEKKPNTVLDLYCGIGVMTMLIAKEVSHVRGVEIVASAIKNARDNAQKNAIQNVEFQVGDVKDVLQTLSTIPDLIVLDPPRKGCDKEVLDCLIQSKIKTIVYVSCHPQTMARDLAQLVQRGYVAQSIQPFDNFAQTAHIECVAVLQRQTA